MRSRNAAVLLAILVLFFVFPSLSSGKDNIELVVMVSEDPVKEAPKYEALSMYIKGKSDRIGGIRLRIARDYPEAAALFSKGEAQGMFAGSFVGAVLIKKGLAKPVARPQLYDGTSTYRALVVAKAGTPAFTGLSDFESPPGTRRKIVAYCAIASAGEVFVRSLLPPGVKPEDRFSPYICASHEAALKAVAEGVADYAVIKNKVWNPSSYPGLAVVGGDDKENPNLTLILTPASYDRYGDDLSRVLLGLEKDTGEGAQRVKNTFGCKSFIPTTASDFLHTYWLMEKAHVDPKTFDFAF